MNFSKEMVYPISQKVSSNLNAHSLNQIELYCGYVTHFLRITPSYFLSIHHFHNRSQIPQKVGSFFRTSRIPLLGLLTDLESLRNQLDPTHCHACISASMLLMDLLADQRYSVHPCELSLYTHLFALNTT
jgi:hypothetical protein